MKRTSIVSAAAAISLAGCSDFSEGFKEGYEDKPEAALETELLDTSEKAYVNVTRCMVVNERLSTVYMLVADASESEEKKQSVSQIASTKAKEAEEFGALLDQMVETRKLNDDAKSQVAQTVSSEIEGIEDENDFIEMAEAFEAIASQCNEDYTSAGASG